MTDSFRHANSVEQVADGTMPPATTTTKTAMSSRRMTRRRMSSSGTDRAVTAIMNASTVPIGRPLPRSASTIGMVPAALA